MSTNNEAYLIIDKALESKNFTQAMSFARARIKQFPEDPYGPFWLGVCLAADLRFAESIVAFNQALALDELHYNSLAYLIYAKSCVGDWIGIDFYKTQLLSATDDDFSLGNLRYINPSILFGIIDDNVFHKKLAISRAGYYFATRPTWKINGYVAPNENILKIGYISPHFNSSALGLIMRKIFSFHDREKFLIYCYGLSPSDGQINEEIVASADFYQDFSGITDFEAAQRIHKDGIHILIDLCGYLPEARARILAMKPAPVICNLLGPGFTMGAKYIKYMITDENIIPTNYKDSYTEKLFYSADTPFATEPFTFNSKITKATSNRASEGLAEDAFVYCCFCKPEYITQETFSLWLKILKDTPNSVLWLSSNRTLLLEQNLQEYAVNHEIESHRIIFSHSENCVESCKHSLADVWLSPLSFSSHPEILTSFWVGLPVVTLSGKTAQARIAAAYYHAIGLSDYIATDKQSYRDIAVSLYNDANKYQEIQHSIKQQVLDSGLYKPDSFIHNLEEIYQQMWLDYLGE